MVKVAGSAPQETGARMWVSAERFAGTLGGGEFERRVLEHSRDILKEPKAKPHLKEYVLCKELGQCCGGRAEVFFEPIPRRKAAFLFGAGHVGRALAQTLSGMPLEIHLIDGRSDWNAPEGAVSVRCEDPFEFARSRAWSPQDAACVFTHSHDLDFKLVRHLLRTSVGYLGLIGSEHKAKVFQARLKDEDLSRLWEEKVRCPIGLGLPSKNPKVIAVAAAAELLKDWGLE